MTMQERQLLAQQQGEGLAGVLGGRGCDQISGGDAAHAAEVLRGKRRREVALASPRLTEVLGERFGELFEDYASQLRYPRRGGPVADAAGFARYLKEERLLPPDAAFEEMSLDVRAARRFRCGIIHGRWVIMIRVTGRAWVLRI